MTRCARMTEKHLGDEMLDYTTVLCLCLISLVLALLSFFISLKNQNHYAEGITIAAISFGGFFFSDNDGFQIRILIIAVLLVSYGVCYGAAHLIRFIYKKTQRDTNGENTQGKAMVVSLPIEYKYTVEKRFIEDIPANVDMLACKCENIRLLTADFKDKFSKLTDDSSKEKALKAYFLGICYHLASMFDSSTRVHVRILQGGSYQKYLATYEGSNGKEDLKNMKIMSLDNKMINESYKHRCSLIKTLNPTLHEEGSNSKWKNYLMFAIPFITHENRPVFSMGISVTRKVNELFYFLNYCEIEKIIGRHIEDIVDTETCQFKDFVERYYFSSS